MTQESQMFEVRRAYAYYYIILKTDSFVPELSGEHVFDGSREECEIYCELIGARHMSRVETRDLYVPVGTISAWDKK